MAVETRPREVDLVFVVDNTGSMGPYINEVRTHLVRIIVAVLGDETVDSARIGLISYRDHPPQDKSFVTQVTPLTANYAKIRTAVDRMQAKGGGDFPECMTDALFELVRQPWRPAAAKLAVLVADAPPHGLKTPDDGFPNGCPCGMDWREQAAACGEMGVRVFGVVCNRRASIVEGVFLAIAAATRAAFYRLDRVEHLAPLITHLTAAELGRLELRDRVAWLLHDHSELFLELPTEQARLAYLVALLSGSGAAASGEVIYQGGKVLQATPVVVAAPPRSAGITAVQQALTAVLREEPTGVTAGKLFPLFFAAAAVGSAEDQVAASSAVVAAGLVVGDMTVRVTGVEVRAVIAPTARCAVVTLHQRFRSTVAEASEATYYLPVTPHAAVTHVAVTVNGTRMIGKCMLREKAQNDYDDSLASGHIAALLEHSKPGVAALFVGNLPPYAEVVCEVRLVMELLASDSDTLVLRIPTSYAPVSAGPTDDPVNSQATVVAHRYPVIICCKAQRGTDDLQVALECTSHPDLIATDTQEGVEITSSAAQTIGLARDFVFTARLNANPNSVGSLVVQSLPNGGANVELHPTAALAAFSAFPASKLPPLPLPKLILCIDTSASMRGPALASAVAVADAVLRLLVEGGQSKTQASVTIPPVGSFLLVAFASSMASHSSTFVPVTPTSVKEARQWLHAHHVATCNGSLEGSFPVGGTEVRSLLHALAGDVPQGNRHWPSVTGLRDGTSVVLVTDGAFSVGEIEPLISAACNKLAVAAVGERPAASNLESVARAGRTGRAESILSATDYDCPAILASAQRLLWRLATPVKHAAVHFVPTPAEALGNLDDVIIPGMPPPPAYALWDVQPSVISCTLKLEFCRQSKCHPFEVCIDSGTESQFIDGSNALREGNPKPMLHSLAARALLDQSQNPAALSIMYNIISSYTSFVAVTDCLNTPATGPLRTSEKLSDSPAEYLSATRPDDSCSGSGYGEVVRLDYRYAEKGASCCGGGSSYRVPIEIPESSPIQIQSRLAARKTEIEEAVAALLRRQLPSGEWQPGEAVLLLLQCIAGEGLVDKERGEPSVRTTALVVAILLRWGDQSLVEAAILRAKNWLQIHDTGGTAEIEAKKMVSLIPT